MILMVDNYDSFSYNLVQMLTMEGAQGQAVRNDADSGAAIRRHADVPILGVCLGHQALGVAFGATVDRAPRLMHGKTSPVRHGDQGVFAGLPNPFEATRYHSLEVKEGTLPQELEPLAWADDGTLMGLRHRGLPYWGVQFHPESVLTGSGPHLLSNFLDLCKAKGGANA